MWGFLGKTWLLSCPACSPSQTLQGPVCKLCWESDACRCTPHPTYFLPPNWSHWFFWATLLPPSILSTAATLGLYNVSCMFHCCTQNPTRTQHQALRPWQLPPPPLTCWNSFLPHCFWPLPTSFPPPPPTTLPDLHAALGRCSANWGSGSLMGLARYLCEQPLPHLCSNVIICGKASNLFKLQPSPSLDSPAVLQPGSPMY